MRKCRVLLVLMGLVLIGGCVFQGNEVTYADRLNLNWSAQQAWTVRTTRWPARIQSPAQRGDTTVRRVWQYGVSRPMREASQSGQLRVTSNGDRYLMNVSRGFSVRSVKAITPTQEPGILQTRWIGYNRSWEGSGPLYPTTSRPKLENLWFVPSLSGTQLNQWKRFAILSSQQATGRWIEQKVVPLRDGLKFVLRNRSRTERIEFEWFRGDPWPTSVVWTFHGRVVGTSRLVSVSRAG